ncbi:hypothetical protein C5N14_02545 [Micromonospora sp. MW-13]|uniref:hypothetical protein n=1 Tax=Micromonospora sp. MW-13 TaxID=2094022 RepID=UPI000ED3947F|nr:hypothetical protein C5N14_02545 [Micromonospora sp. MW-13]
MKAHRTDFVSLVFGLVFVALAAWWLFAQLLGLDLPPVGWFLAGGLILVGTLGLVGALRSGRGDRHDAARPAPANAVDAGSGDRHDAARPTPADAVDAGFGDRPGTGGPLTGAGPAPADEWPTAAVADGWPEAVEDRPVSDGGPARWSPTDPLDTDPAGGPPPGPAAERVTEPLPRLTADPTVVDPAPDPTDPTPDPTDPAAPDAPRRGPQRADG